MNGRICFKRGRSDTVPVMPRPTAKKVTVIDLQQISDELLDTIDNMLKNGELKHTPPDYWVARKELARRRRLARRLQ